MCLAPIVLQDGNGLLSRVRCGRCKMCRIRRKQAWVGRLLLERNCHKDARFLTLTYKRAKRCGRLDLNHLRDFLKRYRYYYGRCRFFAVGEYGSKNEGEHWHVIIFGHAPIKECSPFSRRGVPWKDNKAWTFGFSWDGNVNVESIGYVAGYTLKGASDDPEHQPVVRMSLRPGIGLSRIRAFARAAAREGCDVWPTYVRLQGRRYPLGDGALAAFQNEYLESGGVPPLMSTPEERDIVARADLCDWGTRFEEEERALASSYREAVDVFAAKKIR